jgi:guanylate kinase
MGAEGFHYCFRSYSSFEEIMDEKFHELRKTYLSISSQLEEYVKSKVEEGQR